MISIEKQAAAAGGKVVVLFGDTEVEFLANPAGVEALGKNKQWVAEIKQKYASVEAFMATPEATWLKGVSDLCSTHHTWSYGPLGVGRSFMFVVLVWGVHAWFA